MGNCGVAQSVESFRSRDYVGGSIPPSCEDFDFITYKLNFEIYNNENL